ncbi:hypothetical protein [Streptomyces sp. NPDC090025]|uniref:hypothetical protein n=1 Tax=Streptomyces sp. NPDC090025 TaxID=3365922 RepID=UPI00383722C1
MNALQQHLFDSYRAAQHGEPAPPAPGTHDVATLRAVRDQHRFESVIAGRPARGRWRLLLVRAFRRAGAPVH